MFISHLISFHRKKKRKSQHTNLLITYFRFFRMILRGIFLSFRDIYFILNISAIIIISSIFQSPKLSISLSLSPLLINYPRRKINFSYVWNWEIENSLNWASHCISTPQNILFDCWFHQTLLFLKIKQFSCCMRNKEIFLFNFLIISIDLID